MTYLTATEARAITEQNEEKLMEKFMSKIEESAKKGENEYLAYQRELTKGQQVRLVHAGYTIDDESDKFFMVRW